jgi:hypothetical protein
MVNATFVAMAAESPAIVEASADDDGQVKRRRRRRGISWSLLPPMSLPH